MRWLVAIAVIALAAVFLLRRHAPPASPAPETPIAAKAEPPAARSALITAPRKPLDVKPGPGLPESCLRFWNELRQLDLAEKNVRLPTASGCAGFPPSLAQWDAAYRANCEPAPTSACEESLYDYRAAVTELLTAGTKVSDISDPKVLTDKMIARLHSGDSAAVAEVAERLLDLQPDTSTARAAVISRLRDAEGAAGKPDDPRWKKVDEDFDRAGNADPKLLLDAKLYAENLRYLDPAKLSETAGEISRRNPTLGVGPYHQAWAEYQSGNRAKALELAEEASRREPADPRFRATLEGLKRGEGDPFTVNFNFNFAPQ